MDTEEVVDDEGEHATVPARMAARRASKLTVGSTLPERLLAAALYWRLSPPAADAVLARAVAAAQVSPLLTRCAFAATAAANGRAELSESLELPDSTRHWLSGAGLARQGRLVEAAHQLVDLPAGTYPARLAVWSRAAADLDATVGEKVLEQLDAFLGCDPEQDLAVALVRTSLGSGAERHEVDLTSLLSEPAGVALRDACTARARELRRTASAKLLSALDDLPSLAASPHLLESAPPALLDDLIDEGKLNEYSLSIDLPARTWSYLAARVDPTRLDNAALQRFDLTTERARRSLMAQQPLPSSLPESVAARFRSLADLVSGNASVAVAADLLDDEEQADELRDLLSEPATRVPGDGLLAAAMPGSIWEHLATSVLQLESIAADQLTVTQQGAVGAVALRRSRAALYDGDMAQAERLARECLRLCGVRKQRGEALNLIACVCWLREDDEAAIRALEAALAGDYSHRLQANIGIVARELDPGLAGRHLAQLVSKAPNLELRVAAAHSALMIWANSDITGEQRNDLPRELALALRQLLAESLSMEDFRPLARLMADHDAEWMAGFTSRRSPNANTESARLYAARAAGFETYIRAMKELLNSRSADQPWLAAERSSLLEMVQSGLLENDSDIAASGLVEMLVAEDFPMSFEQGITLRSLSTWIVARTISQEGRQEPAERLVERTITDSNSLAQAGGGSDEKAEVALTVAFDALARAYLIARWEQLKDAAAFHDRLVADTFTVTMRRRNREVAANALHQITSFTSETERLLERVRPYVADEELLTMLSDLSSSCRDLARSARDNLGRWV